MTQLRVGLIGTGRISDIYLRNAAQLDELDILASGSLNRAESEAKDAASGVQLVADPDEILPMPDIDAIRLGWGKYGSPLRAARHLPGLPRPDKGCRLTPSQ